MAVVAILVSTAINAAEQQPSASTLPAIYAYRAENVASLRKGFANPPREAGPWVYWFWFDNVVNREEITRELQEREKESAAD